MSDEIIVIPPAANEVSVTIAGAPGPQGPTGATGPSGVISVTSPITNTGTSTAATIGINQALLSIGASQVTGTALTQSTNFVGDVTGTAGATVVGTLPASRISGTALTQSTNFAGQVTGTSGNLVVGTLPSLTVTNTVSASVVSATNMTVTAAATQATDVTNKTYVDTVASGINAHDAVQGATTTQLSATYDNGTSGYLATLTATSNGVFDIDGVAAERGVAWGINDRVLVKDQSSNKFQNGIYYFAAAGDVGSGSTPWKLTRALDSDQPPEFSSGDFTYVLYGTVNKNFTYIQTSKVTNVGVDSIDWTVLANGNFGAVIGVNQGGTGATTLTGLLIGNGTSAITGSASVSPSYITGTALTQSTSFAGDVTGTAGATVLATSGVTASTYGSSSAVPVIAVDSKGRITSASNSSISLPVGQITGVLPLANGGTNATTAALARTSLSAAASGANSDITSITGLTTALSAPQGGTGRTSYTIGDILYASATNALSVRAASTSGYSLISNGAGAAPTYQQVSLTAGVTGTLPLANGGTNATTAALARTSLSAAASGANSDITSITGLTTALSVAQGGTGATTAALARTSLSAAASGANSDITSITGLTTALSIAQGGTAATTAALALTSLGGASLSAANSFTSSQTITPATSVTAATINAAASAIGLIVKLGSSGASNLQEWRANDDSVNSYVSASGALYLNDNNIAVSNNIGFKVKRTAVFDAGQTGVVPVAVWGRSGQTANLTNWYSDS
ncbi:MAG: hypothetical protein EBZ77_06135, partial [Chitinophagia bacterium]|nr:hypothetical protein [Chitinophagia bacterium]